MTDPSLNIVHMAASITTQLAPHIAAYGGACLIIDYGRDGLTGDSLQAVADHQPVDVFHQPGAADSIALGRFQRNKAGRQGSRRAADRTGDTGSIP